MILGFKQQFIEPILKGSKIHTIREDKHNRWKVGKIIHFATGVRTKNYNCFLRALCLRTQIIKITYPVIGTENFTLPLVSVDDNLLTISEIHALAVNDGFKNLEEFLTWFNKPFTGKIIHWTSKSY